MKRLILYLLAGFALSLTSCKQKQPDMMRIKVLVTTDIHGTLFPYDFVKDRPMSTSLSQVFSFVEQERAKKDQKVVLLDNGDILQGQPIVYYSNFEKPQEEHICARVMNFMAYDAGTVGNHDIETGHSVYDKINKDFNFPWLAANAVRNDDGTPWFKPYTIIEREGVRIAVLGLITPAVPQWLPQKKWEGMHFEPMVETARKWVQIIMEEENPDLMIGLFHSGIGEVDNPKNQVAEQASRMVAEQVPGFDLIFCGHDHRNKILWVENAGGGSVAVVDGGSVARHLAGADITLSWDETRNQYDKHIEPKLFDVGQIAVSEKFMNEFEDEFDEVKAYVSRSVGHFTQTISTRDAFVGDAAFMDLIQQVQLDITGADISFAAPLSFNAEINAGDMKVRDLFKLYRFENMLYTMSLTGNEVKDYLEYSYGLWFGSLNGPADHLLKLRKSEKGVRLENPFFNFDAASGINYIVDLTKPVGNRINILGMQDGEAFDLQATYSVALNSYRGNGGGGHLTKGAGIPENELASRVSSVSSKDMRYYIMKWIEEKGEVTPVCDSNWSVTPANLYHIAKENDYGMLFGR